MDRAFEIERASAGELRNRNPRRVPSPRHYRDPSMSGATAATARIGNEDEILCVLRASARPAEAGSRIASRSSPSRAIASVPLRRGVQTASHTRRESVSISSPPVVKIIGINAESWRIFLVVSKSSFAMPA
jgi:hypothetical protein